MSSPAWRRRRSKRRLREALGHAPVSTFMPYRSRSGKIIPLWRWAWLFDQLDYRRVATTTIGDITVSTIWDGMDTDGEIFGGTACIFETGVNRGRGRWDIVGRWSTEAIAREAHDNCVRALS